MKKMDTKTVYGFTGTLLILSSHLSPIVKTKDKIKFYSILKDLNIDFNPENYSEIIDNIELTNFYINFVFDYIGKNIERNLFFTNILQNFSQLFNNLFSGMKINQKFSKFNDQIDDINFNKEIIEDTLFILKSIQLGLNPKILKIIIDDKEFNPKIVSQFVYCQFIDEITILKKQNSEYLSVIDRRNGELVQLKKKLLEEERSYQVLKKERDTLNKNFNEISKKNTSLTEEIEKIRQKNSDKEIRKNRINDLRKRLRILLQNDDKKTLDDVINLQNEYNKLQEEYDQFTKDVPCCSIMKETLQELKKQEQEIVSTTCGHIFSRYALDGWLKLNQFEQKCPTCKRNISKKDIHPIFI